MAAYGGSMVNSGLEGIVAATTRLSHVDGERGELVIAGYAGRRACRARHLRGDDVAAVARRAAVGARSSRRSAPSSRPRARSRRRRSLCCANVRAPVSSRWTPCAPRPARSRSRPTSRQESWRCMPTIVAAYWRLRRAGADRPAAGPRSRGELPLHAERRGAGSGAGPRARDLPEHRHRSRAQCVDVHRACDHVNRIRSRVGRRRRVGRAEGAAARRRAGAGARHGVRDRRRVAGRGDPAREDRSRREADGIRPPRLQGARSASRRAREGRRADVHACGRHVALHAGALGRGDGHSTARGVQAGTTACRPTSSSTPRCCCTASDSTSSLFTPTFAISRVSGWIAHALEQRRANRIIRPQSEYTGPRDRRWVPLSDRIEARA